MCTGQVLGKTKAPNMILVGIPPTPLPLHVVEVYTVHTQQSETSLDNFHDIHVPS